MYDWRYSIFSLRYKMLEKKTTTMAITQHRSGKIHYLIFFIGKPWVFRIFLYVYPGVVNYLDGNLQDVAFVLLYGGFWHQP